MPGADEIIEDYASSLEWLQTNDRYAINNFTVIAKENTEHADAISQVLVDHITKAHPNHKLPALYVLDSIAKNIGTPYTLFLGHRLYNTFMGAYSLVDNNVRRKLDEMLRTWKHSIPGSLDSRPVFDPNITKRIENALIQAKTRTLESEQRQQREQQELLRRRAPGTSTPGQWRNTPTPPQNGSHFPLPTSQGFVGYGGPNNLAPPQTHSPFPPNNLPLHQVPPQQYPGPGFIPPNRAPSQNQFADFNSLERDVQDLINRFQDLVTRNYSDTSLQTKLKALRDLQTILISQSLPPDQLQAVRAQLDTLQASLVQYTQAMVPTPSPQIQNYSASVPAQSGYQAPYQPPYQPPPSIPPPIPPQFPPQQQNQTPVQPPPSGPSMPSANFLASLLAGRSTTPQTAQSAPPPPTQPPSASPAANPLLAQLRASGLLSASATPESSASQSTPASQNPMIPNLSGLSALLRPPLKEKKNDVELSSASLKIPHPQLIEKLYKEQPNQCLTCGKRYLANEDGKARKARHMDWHFKTNQRLVEAASRGQSRSWYVDEMEWIKFRDSGDSLEEDGGQGTNENDLDASVAAKNDPKSKFIPVPSGNQLPCGICQEKFVTSWNDELQDFVWIDAVRVGDRIYHASCYQDFRKDGGSTPGRIATPDSVLGKRKADAGSENPSPAKRVVSEA